MSYKIQDFTYERAHMENVQSEAIPIVPSIGHI
jgi:hypothetical protein